MFSDKPHIKLHSDGSVSLLSSEAFLVPNVWFLRRWRKRKFVVVQKRPTIPRWGGMRYK